MAKRSKASITHRNNLQEHLRILEIRQQQVNQEMLATKLALDKVDEINYSDTLKISDHAIVRYMERIMNVDMSEVRSKILTEMVDKAYSGLKTSGEYPTGNGYSVIIKKGVITTVVI